MKASDLEEFVAYWATVESAVETFSRRLPVAGII
jgi:hypothetical protein